MPRKKRVSSDLPNRCREYRSSESRRQEAQKELATCSGKDGKTRPARLPMDCSRPDRHSEQRLEGPDEKPSLGSRLA